MDGKVFVITGQGAILNRDSGEHSWSRVIVANGGLYKKQVTQSTTHVVMCHGGGGRNANGAPVESSKKCQAALKQKEITATITEQDLWDLIVNDDAQRRDSFKVAQKKAKADWDKQKKMKRQPNFG